MSAVIVVMFILTGGTPTKVGIRRLLISKFFAGTNGLIAMMVLLRPFGCSDMSRPDLPRMKHTATTIPINTRSV
jgi:hypothetical protein